MLPRHPRYTQAGLSGAFGAFNIDLDLLKRFKRAYRRKWVLFLKSETLLPMCCRDNG